MTDVVLITAADDAAQAFEVALDLERQGWSVAWDGGLGSRDEWGADRDAEVRAAGCAVVLWSRDAKYSHPVTTGATAAQRRGKLIGATLDGASPPYGFTPPDVDLAAGEAGKLVLVVAAALRLGPASYWLSVRARLEVQVFAAVWLLRGGVLGGLAAAFGQVRRRRGSR